MAMSTSVVYRDGAPSIDMGGRRGRVHGVSIVHKRSGQPKCYRYTGIPYAVPPIGANRFKKTVPLPNDFQYDLNRRVYCDFADVCPQPSNYDFLAGQDVAARIEPSHTDSYSENCLTLNVWVPAAPPRQPEGYPVLFFLHGGWLQIGSPHHTLLRDPSDLLASHEEGGKDFGAIIVTPGYRLNVFGFLSMPCMAQGERGNFGFWDQRTALEWVSENIKAFQGNPENITIGGLSAGAHSAYSQAMFEYMRLRHAPPEQKPLFRRLFLQSNCALIPVKTVQETASQVKDLLRSLNIDHSPDSIEALEALRNVDAKALMDVLPSLPVHTFRATRGPGEFVDGASWSRALLDGDFGRWCKQHGVEFMLGEVAQEECLYSLVNPPLPSESESVQQAFERQVANYYPLEATKKLLQAYSMPDSDDPSEWRRLFGTVTADSQVYAAERLFVRLLMNGGLGPESIFRYQIVHRPTFLDRYMPKWMGVSHSFDDAIWWFSRPFLTEPYADTLEGEQLLDQLRYWLFPFRVFVEGDGADRKDLPRIWYGRKLRSSEAQNGQMLRRLTTSLQALPSIDDRWAEKEGVMNVLHSLLEDAANEKTPPPPDDDRRMQTA